MRTANSAVKGPIVTFVPNPGESAVIAGELIDWRAYVLEDGERVDLLLVESEGKRYLVLNPATGGGTLCARDFDGTELPEDPRIFNWAGWEPSDADGLHTMTPIARAAGSFGDCDYESKH